MSILATGVRGRRRICTDGSVIGEKSTLIKRVRCRGDGLSDRMFLVVNRNSYVLFIRVRHCSKTNVDQEVVEDQMGGTEKGNCCLLLNMYTALGQNSDRRR